MRRIARASLRAHHAVLAGATLALLAAVPPASAAPFVFVTEAGQRQILRYDAPSPAGTLTALAPTAPTFVGATPRRIAITPDGQHAYVINEGSDTVTSLDVGLDGSLTQNAPAHVATGDQPWAVVMAPDGGHLYVTNFDKSISVFAVEADGDLVPAQTLAVAESATQAVISPDGRHLYVVLEPLVGARDLGRFDIAADGTLAAAPVLTAIGGASNAVAITPDGGHLFAAGDVIRQFARAADGTLTPRSPATVDTGAITSSLAIAHDGTALYAGGLAGTLHQFRIDDAGLTALTPASLALPAVPSRGQSVRAIAIHPDGDTAWVLDTAGPRIHQLDLAPGGQATPKAGTPFVDPGGTPLALAVTPRTDLAVTQAVVPVPGAEGEELELRISAANVRGVPATGVVVTTTLPADLTFVSATVPGGTCTGVGTVTCSLPSIVEGASRTAAIRVRAVRAGTIALTSSASALQPDPVAANNTAVPANVAVAPRPGATSAPAGDVSSSGATLNGVVAPAGTNTTYRFELGTSAAYGMPTAAARSAGAGAAGRVVSEAITGLSPDTVYHYRLVVTNDQGATVRGADMTFRTAPTPPGPVTIRETVTVPAPVTPSLGEDRQAPIVSRLALTRSLLTFRVSEAATVRATIEERRARRVRSGARRRTVTSWRTVRRLTARSQNAGGLSIALDKRLGPGRYRVTIVATDAAGNASRPATRAASIAKPRARR